MKLISARYPLIAGFTLLLALLIGVSAVGVTRNEQVNGRLQALIAEQHVKSGRVSEMVRITRERSQLLYQLFAEKDPTERTREAERYWELGRELKEASEKLAGMPLNPEEHQALAELL